MSTDTILTVKNEHLELFSPEEAVNFFRELLWAEATSLGIGKTLINVPSAITVADGGIDAEVRDVLLVRAELHGVVNVLTDSVGLGPHDGGLEGTDRRRPARHRR